MGGGGGGRRRNDERQVRGRGRGRGRRKGGGGKLAADVSSSPRSRASRALSFPSFDLALQCDSRTCRTCPREPDKGRHRGRGREPARCFFSWIWISCEFRKRASSSSSSSSSFERFSRTLSHSTFCPISPSRRRHRRLPRRRRRRGVGASREVHFRFKKVSKESRRSEGIDVDTAGPELPVSFFCSLSNVLSFGTLSHYDEGSGVCARTPSVAEREAANRGESAG